MVYGFGTRSYFRSTEHRENKRQQAEATAKYIAEPKREVTIGPFCSCRSFDLPHELSKHAELRSEMDWRTQSERRRNWERA